MFSLVIMSLIIRIVLASCPSDLIEDGTKCYTFKTTEFPYDCPYALPLLPEDYPKVANDMPHWWAKKDENYGYFLKFGYELYNFNAIVEKNFNGECFYKLNGKYIISNCNKKDVYGFCVYDKTDESFCEIYHQICKQTCKGKSKFKSRFLCGANFDVTDNCEYCDYEYENYPKLEITIYRHENSMRVVMKNYKNVITPRYKSLYCFSYMKADYTFIREEISESEIVTISETNEILINEFPISSDGIYFCEAFIYPDQEIIKSNEVIITSLGEEVHNFVVNITADMSFQSMPYSLLHDQLIAIENVIITENNTSTDTTTETSTETSTETITETSTETTTESIAETTTASTSETIVESTIETTTEVFTTSTITTRDTTTELFTTSTIISTDTTTELFAPTNMITELFTTSTITSTDTTTELFTTPTITSTDTIPDLFTTPTNTITELFTTSTITSTDTTTELFTTPTITSTDTITDLFTTPTNTITELFTTSTITSTDTTTELFTTPTITSTDTITDLFTTPTNTITELFTTSTITSTDTTTELFTTPTITSTDTITDLFTTPTNTITELFTTSTITSTDTTTELFTTPTITSTDTITDLFTTPTNTITELFTTSTITSTDTTTELFTTPTITSTDTITDLFTTPTNTITELFTTSTITSTDTTTELFTTPTIISTNTITDLFTTPTNTITELFTTSTITSTDTTTELFTTPTITSTNTITDLFTTPTNTITELFTTSTITSRDTTTELFTPPIITARETTNNIALRLNLLNLYPQISNKITIGFLVTAQQSLTLEETYEDLKERLPPQYSFSSCDYCIEEKLFINEVNLTWPSSKLGTTIPSKEFLVTTNGLPITRTCFGNFKQGAYWSDPSSVEDSFVTPSDITHELNSIVTNTNLTAEETNILLSEIITNKNELNVIPYDVYLISECLNRIINSNDTYDVKIALDNIESTMKFNSKTLYSSQIYLNATDNILYAYDRMLQNQINDSPLVIVEGNQTMGQIIKMDVYNGLAIYERNKKISVEYLNVQDQNEINKSNLIVGSFLPSNLIEEIQEIFLRRKLKNTHIHLIASIFLNNRLFNDDENRHDWQVIGLSIPKLKYNYFINSFPVIFGERYSNFHGTICNYWNYGIDDQQVSIFGKWKPDGNITEGKNYKICYYNHMTHFSLMFGAPEDKGVNVITAIVTSLSLICIISIFITAIIFEKWRREESVKVLLHYSGAIMLQDVLILIFDLININSILCSIYGILLHFSILAQFIWMLIINYVQYRKLIKVFNSSLSKHTLKFIISAWLLPLIPILIVLSINLNAYQNDTYCFISSLNLYLGLFLPMSLIIFFNILIFIIILKSLFTRSNAVGKSLLKKRISIAILLFFLSGFTWTFGLLANVFQNIILSYIFCTLSIIQGVILWIFFILMRKDVVKHWLKAFKREFDITKQNRFKIRRPTLDTKSVSNIATILSDY